MKKHIHGWQIYLAITFILLGIMISTQIQTQNRLMSDLSLQSTSDQTDYLYNANIAANVASAVAPEQGGMWVYPYEDEEEHVIYNVVNGMLLRPYH